MAGRIKVVKVSGLPMLPTRRQWGEAWWTARDINFLNAPDLPDPLEALADAVARRLQNEFLFGRQA